MKVHRTENQLVKIFDDNNVKIEEVAKAYLSDELCTLKCHFSFEIVTRQNTQKSKGNAFKGESSSSV